MCFAADCLSSRSATSQIQRSHTWRGLQAPWWALARHHGSCDGRQWALLVKGMSWGRCLWWCFLRVTKGSYIWCTRIAGRSGLFFCGRKALAGPGCSVSVTPALNKGQTVKILKMLLMSFFFFFNVLSPVLTVHFSFPFPLLPPQRTPRLAGILYEPNIASWWDVRYVLFQKASSEQLFANLNSRNTIIKKGKLQLNFGAVGSQRE